MNTLPRFPRALVAGALSLLGVIASQAQIYNENGDAGTSVGTAQATGSGGPLTTINGSIFNSFDGDFFYITITDPALFSATTVGGTQFGLDTMLYLFTMEGNPVYLNDDDPSGATLASTLPPGHPMGPMTIGTYILGISLSEAEPINSSNQNLFAAGQFSTTIRGPNPGVAGPVVGIRQPTFSFGSGAYSIRLTGAASSPVPEPGTVALIAFAGLGGVIGWCRRARRTLTE